MVKKASNKEICLNLLKVPSPIIYKYRILGECLLISSLPGKTLKTLVELRGLPSDLICVLKVEPGKLDIKRPKHAVLLISLPIGSLFKLAIMT